MFRDYDGGSLILERHNCPFQSYCKCLCDFDSKLCEADCNEQETGHSLSAYNHVGCEICNCSCSLFKIAECEVNCSSLSHSQVIGAVDDKGCRICNCSCPLFYLNQCMSDCARNNTGPVLGAINEKHCQICN